MTPAKKLRAFHSFLLHVGSMGEIAYLRLIILVMSASMMTQDEFIGLISLECRLVIASNTAVCLHLATYTESVLPLLPMYLTIQELVCRSRGFQYLKFPYILCS